MVNTKSQGLSAAGPRPLSDYCVALKHSIANALTAAGL